MNGTSKAKSNSGETPSSHLRREYEEQRLLFLAQPPMVQRFLETQARDLAEALVQRQPQVKFKLPDKVITEVAAGEKAKAAPVPADQREQLAGGLVGRLTRTELRNALRERLA